MAGEGEERPASLSDGGRLPELDPHRTASLLTGVEPRSFCNFEVDGDCFPEQMVSEVADCSASVASVVAGSDDPKKRSSFWLL